MYIGMGWFNLTLAHKNFFKLVIQACYDISTRRIEDQKIIFQDL